MVVKLYTLLVKITIGLGAFTKEYGHSKLHCDAKVQPPQGEIVICIYVSSLSKFGFYIGGIKLYYHREFETKLL